MKRVPKGTVQAKDTGDTLILPDVAVKKNNLIVVMLAYTAQLGAPLTVKWGERELGQRSNKVNIGSGLEASMWTVPAVVNNGTRDIVATWDAPGDTDEARAMIVTVVEGANVVDVCSARQLDATTDPATGAVVTTTVDNTFHVALFASKGPSNDTVGTPGSGHSGGQRIGTGGPVPISNVTIQETYEELTSIGACRGTLTGATERDWASIIIAFKPKPL